MASNSTGSGATSVQDLATSLDTFFLITVSIICIFIGCIVYWGVGYTFAYSDGNPFIGHNWWFGTFPEDKLAHWFFQFVFAATACTIVSGGVAERCDFWPYLIYSFLITGFVYPVVSRWAWHPTGWLADGKSVIDGIVYQDFAGSGAVHTTGGIAALVGAIFCGARLGRFDLGGRNPISGHSVPLAALGAFILIFGFFAFNGGSQGAIASEADRKAVTRSVVNTIMSGTGGAVANLTIMKVFGMVQSTRKLGLSRWSLLTTINGCLVGMVSICSSCNIVHMWAAFVIGLISSPVYFAVSLSLMALKIDDPLEAVAVHAGGGIWGVIAAPLFDFEKGAFYQPDNRAGKQLAVNLVGLIAIIAWTAVCSTIIFGALKWAKRLRVSPEVEIKGLDVLKHGEPAYPFVAWQEAWDDLLVADEDAKKDKLSNRPPGMLVQALNNMSVENGNTGVDNKALDDESL